MPDVGCCILARPTKKMGLFRQMSGRVLRPAINKPDAIVLDHSGAVFRHGFVEDPVEWTLDPDRRAESPVHRERGERGSRLRECKNCGVVGVAGEPQRPPRAVEIADGELGLVDHGRRAKPKLYDTVERARWHCMLTYIAQERGYKSGWASVNFKEKFGSWPPWGFEPIPMPPSPEVRSWVKSRQIAYAKRRGAA